MKYYCLAILLLSSCGAVNDTRDATKNLETEMQQEVQATQDLLTENKAMHQDLDFMVSMIKPIADKATPNSKIFCQVSIGPAMLAFAPQCPYGEVQVGIENQELLCAQVEVVCP